MDCPSGFMPRHLNPQDLLRKIWDLEKRVAFLEDSRAETRAAKVPEVGTGIYHDVSRTNVVAQEHWCGAANQVVKTMRQQDDDPERCEGCGKPVDECIDYSNELADTFRDDGSDGEI